MAAVPTPDSDAADPTGDEPTIAYLPDELGDGSTACASCRHQRRRCEPTCPLAPYFPATMAAEFEEVRRLHGVRKLVRFVLSVPNSDRRVLVANLIHHALARRADPVMGLVGEVARLQAAILAAKHERDLLHIQLHHLHGNNDHVPTPPPATSSALRWSPTIFHLPVERYEVKEMKPMHLSPAVDEKTAEYMAASAAVKQSLSPSTPNPSLFHGSSQDHLSVESSSLSNIGDSSSLVSSQEGETSSHPISTAASMYKKTSLALNSTPFSFGDSRV